MVYEEKEFHELESELLKYAEHSTMAYVMLKDWRTECQFRYVEGNEQIRDHIRYADERKKLANIFQDNLINFDEKERNSVCKLILQLVKFSDNDDENARTSSQQNAWYINQIVKKYDFNYWEVLLREIGEDETDVVRKVYNYIERWENRIEVIDTFYEYIERDILDAKDKKEVLQFIASMETEC